jgi:hypothetical protein
MTSFQGLTQFPLQEAFTVSALAGARAAGPVLGRDRAVVLSLLREPLLLAAAALLGL